MMRQFQIETLANLFKSMTKRAVPDIMHQSGSQSSIRLGFAPIFNSDAPTDNSHQLSSGVKNANAMREARMRRTGVD